MNSEKIKCPVCGTEFEGETFDECPCCGWGYLGYEGELDAGEKEDYNLMSLNHARKLYAMGLNIWGDPLKKQGNKKMSINIEKKEEISEEIKNKTDEFIRKAKEAGYSEDSIFICGFFVFCEENDGKEEELLSKFIELIDKYPDEREFVAEACSAAGVD